MEGKIFLNEVVDNKERKFGGALKYQPCKVVLEDGTEMNALFTRHAIEEAMERAVFNPEDCPQEELSWWTRTFG